MAKIHPYNLKDIVPRILSSTSLIKIKKVPLPPCPTFPVRVFLPDLVKLTIWKASQEINQANSFFKTYFSLIISKF